MAEQILDPIRPKLEWLKNSTIQRPEGDDAGGVHAWIDEKSGAGSFIYSEITGYFMTLACHIARFEDKADWLSRAEKAAEWIATAGMLDSGALLTRKYLDPSAGKDDPYAFDKGLSIFFDCAMVGFGLTNTYEATQNKRWLDVACKLGDFCLEAFESKDKAERYAAYDTKKGEPLPAGDRWSHHWGSFELKGAMFMDSLARITGEQKYAAFVQRSIEGALPDQQPDGRFGTNIALTVTHLHPHNYTIEALLYLAGRHGRDDLLDRAKRAVGFSFDKCLDESGRVVQAWSESEALVIPELRSDVLAQSLRSYRCCKLFDAAASWEWESRVASLEKLLDSFSLPSGGTSYGQDEYGKKSTHANAWCHFFNTEMQILKLVVEAGSAWDPKQIILT